MTENHEDKKTVKKVGRPKSNPVVDEVVDEKSQVILDMEKKEGEDYISIEDLTNRWKQTFNKMVEYDGKPGIQTVATRWNKLNPFLQNQRIKELYTQAKEYNKYSVSRFLSSPGAFETELRGLSWAHSSSQQIYYNILRRSADIPVYHHYLIPEFFEDQEDYGSKQFKNEERLLNEWIDLFNIPNTFKTIALEVKREGKSSYLFRNKFIGEGKSTKPSFTTLQKLPTEWIKITGKGQLGYTVSFDMMYFLNIANSPSDFGEFIIQAWEDLIEKGIVVDKGGQSGPNYIFDKNNDKILDYEFKYNGVSYPGSLEIKKIGRQQNYFFWLRMPYDICYTFGSDNSHPWVAPDTMGLMLKLQELTDYGQLAGLIASTPLSAVLTGEIETIDGARAGKNESVFSPEVLQGYMQQFNSATSTNIEAWLWPAKNIKLQQLSTDVNSSEIITTSTENLIVNGGESGMTITTDKPNVAQVTVAKLLAASQQNYVTLQFENVMNFIIQHKIGMKYRWKIKIWGNIFTDEADKKYLKEVVANGNIALFPKLMSAEGISMIDTQAIVKYIENADFYKSFKTYTLLAQAAEKEKEISEEDEEDNDGTEEETKGKGAGRKSLDDSEIDNDATAASRDRGDNIADNREQ